MHQRVYLYATGDRNIQDRPKIQLPGIRTPLQLVVIMLQYKGSARFALCGPHNCLLSWYQLVAQDKASMQDIRVSYLASIAAPKRPPRITCVGNSATKRRGVATARRHRRFRQGAILHARLWHARAQKRVQNDAHPDSPAGSLEQDEGACRA